jgi:CRISPR/Cas system-associated endonuclease Cas1
LNELEWLRRKVRRQEEHAQEISLERLSIPNGPQLERVQRYETAIKRDMYRAMDQLERLQRRRRGEPTPPTVNVNVSNDDGV